MTADAAGEFDALVTVYPLFQGNNDEEYVCDGSPETTCMLGDPWPAPTSENRYLMVPLTQG